MKRMRQFVPFVTLLALTATAPELLPGAGGRQQRLKGLGQGA